MLPVSHSRRECEQLSFFFLSRGHVRLADVVTVFPPV
uniref:Uncharacterized protein n=1 Tax=Anguilla anguilla TaxID=7936 RepID=A0A0E9SZZ3_ANGAN